MVQSVSNYRDQYYDQNGRARDNCSDRFHVLGLYERADGELWSAPSVASYRGREDP